MISQFMLTLIGVKLNVSLTYSNTLGAAILSGSEPAISLVTILNSKFFI